MNLKLILAATCLAMATLTLGVGTSLALDQTNIDFSSGTASFTSLGPVLDGGNDVLTFTNVSTDLYDFTLTMSGQYLTLTSANLNGITGTILDTGKWTFLGIDGASNSPLVLTLFGTTDNSLALYSGELTASPNRSVPEPTTSLLMLIGLGLIGFATRKQHLIAQE